MIVEDDVVYMTIHEYEELPEYSCSLPTGMAEGKRWKCGRPYMEPRQSWHMGEYGHSQDGGIPIIWRQIFIHTGSLFNIEPKRPDENSDTKYQDGPPRGSLPPHKMIA